MLCIYFPLFPYLLLDYNLLTRSSLFSLFLMSPTYCSLFIFLCLSFTFYIRFKFVLFSSLCHFILASCFFLLFLRPLYLSLLSPRFLFFLYLCIAHSFRSSCLSMSLFPLHYFLLAPITTSLLSFFLLFLHFEVARSHQSGFRFSVPIPGNIVSMPTTHVTLQVTDNLLSFPLPNSTSLYK